MLKQEFRRAFVNKYFLLAILLAILTLIFGIIDYMSGPNPREIPGASPFLNNTFDAFLWAQGSLFALVAPIIAVLAFGDSYVVDRLKGYQNFILLRTTYRKYLTVKFIANLLAGGMSLALPLLILYGFTNIAFLRGFPPETNARIPYYMLPGPLGSIYAKSPDLYIFFLIFLAFIFGIAYSTFALAFSIFIRNRYIVLATPFLFYIVIEFILQILGLPNWGPTAALVPWIRTSVTSTVIFVEVGTVFLASTLCILFGARKKALLS